LENSLRESRVLPGHDYGCADAHPLVQVDDVGIVHADAAVGDEPADRARRVGAVDRVLAAIEGHRRGPHRVLRRSPGDDVGQRWLVAPDLAWWRPRGPQKFPVDMGLAGPL